MSYRYQDVRPRLFTEQGFRLIQQVRDTGAKLTSRLLYARERECSGDSWMMLAAVDYLVEEKQFKRIETEEQTSTQDRVYKFVGSMER